MNESFLHYVWQFQYFRKDDLVTSDHENLLIFQPGQRNSNSGPDFSNAKIRIGKLEWRGSVEIHVKASGWNDHQHGKDAAYEKVVLHVVWENDKPIQRNDGTMIPTLELKNRVDPAIWNRFAKLFTSTETIPCTSGWSKVSEIIKLSMLDKTVIQRLESKAQLVSNIFAGNNNDWEETFYQLILKNFGFKVNTEPMLQLAQGLPYKILLKHPVQVEALLFGQAGFLEQAKDDEYTVILKREYAVLSKKYNLNRKQMNEAQWRFLRLRPANFPTIRLAQFASLVVSRPNLFSTILERSSDKNLFLLLKIDQSDYWKHHYRPGVKSKTKIPSLGNSSIQNIVINTIVPLLVAYGRFHDDQSFIDRAVGLLQDISAENNKITREWTSLGYKVTSAFDSQGLIELYNNFCMRRRCLECNVGLQLIKS